jgi:nucleoside-diphosphate-sugar epimerase
MPTAMTEPSILWVGGTSALTRTFVEELPLTRKMLLAAPDPPGWKLPMVYNVPEIQMMEANTKCIGFVPLDLCNQASVDKVLDGQTSVDTLIYGARASLVWEHTKHMQLVTNLERLLNLCIDKGVKKVLNISSIAVANHILEQENDSEKTPLPPLDTYASPYDRSKR